MVHGVRAMNSNKKPIVYRYSNSVFIRNNEAINIKLNTCGENL